MAWTEDLLANHAALSEVDIRFRDFAMATPNCLDMDYLLKFGFQEPESVYYTGGLHPWPFFVGRQMRSELERVTLGLSRLHRLIPERIFDNDPERIAAYYGLDPLFTELLVEPPNGLDSALARADLVGSSDGLKCVEFNFGSRLGGTEARYRTGIYRQVPEFQEFLAREGLSWAHRDTVREMFAHFFDEALRLGLGKEGTLNLGLLIDQPLLFGMGERFAREFDAALRDSGLPLGGRLHVCWQHQLREEEGALRLAGARLHGLVEMTVRGTHPAVYPLAAAGELVLFNGPIHAILAGKQNLALLSEYQDSECFTAEERELLRGHLPWTRVVERKDVRFDGRDWDLPTLLAERRGDLVLKSCRSLGGKDVAIGRASTDAEWQAAIDTALSGDLWIVQEFVVSKSYLALSDAGVERHDLIWGPFAFGSRFGGNFLRLQPTRVGGAINASRTGSASSMYEV
ncbi:MAG: hypothetical protein ABJC13_06875 [Acidobacteriota bacterium]